MLQNMLHVSLHSNNMVWCKSTSRKSRSSHHIGELSANVHKLDWKKIKNTKPEAYAEIEYPTKP